MTTETEADTMNRVAAVTLVDSPQSTTACGRSTTTGARSSSSSSEEGDLRGRRVLDCGCGTGRLSQALAESAASKVWGIDPEPEMLRVAAGNVPAGVGLKSGRAEDLPFRDGWFERAVLWLVCHLVDRQVAFRELRRVLADDGRLVVVTFDPAHFGEFWLNQYFPSLEAVDRARFPDADELNTQLTAQASPACVSCGTRSGRRSRESRPSSGSNSVTSRRSTCWSRPKSPAERNLP